MIRNPDSTRKEAIFSVIITINAAFIFPLYPSILQAVTTMADEGSTGD